MGLYTLILILLIIGIFVEVRKNKRVRYLNKQLQKEHTDTVLILENLVDGVIECDKNMTIRKANRAALGILRVASQDIIGKSFANTSAGSPNDQLMGKILYPEKKVSQGQDTLVDTINKNLQTSHKGTSVHRVEFPGDNGTELLVFSTAKTHPATREPLGYIKILRELNLSAKASQKQVLPSGQEQQATA